MKKTTSLTNGQISVIIPVYNCKNYLEKTIESVLSQEYKDIDVVLIDDGSTDGSSELCDFLSEKNKKIYVIHKENGGVSSARNVGIEYVIKKNKNGYIAFLDSDDAWMKGVFKSEVCLLLNKGYDLIGMQSCECNSRMNRRKEPISLKEGIYAGGADLVWVHSGQSFGAMLYSCEFIKKCRLRFVEDINYSEDKIFSMYALYLANNVYLMEQLMYLYRKNEGSLMHSRKYGISYYKPIIDAYIILDETMEKWITPQRKKSNVGVLSASVYIMDMVDEHFQHFRSKKEIDKVINGNQQYLDILLGNFGNVIPNSRYRQYIEKPLKYCLKNYIKGLILNCMRGIKKIFVIAKLNEKLSYQILL